MIRYALLLAPSANRVYADAAARLARAELAVFAGSGVLDVVPAAAEVTGIGGVEYLTFTTAEPGLGERDLAHLANLSAAYALFERVGDDLLRPVPLRPLARYDSDLITIPKYAGKTNEQFTGCCSTSQCSPPQPRRGCWTGRWWCWIRSAAGARRSTRR